MFGRLLILMCGATMLACASPTAAFKAKQESSTAPTEVQFTNISEQADRYAWDFGDGITSEASSPSHRYRRSGEYTVVLKAFKGKKENISTQQIMINSPGTCLVEIDTPYGRMVVQLFDDTPKHRDNFLKLAEEHFYDGLLFHRVIQGFMIQGGDPESREAAQNARLGSGGPGYQIPSEITENQVHVKGALAAARTGDVVNPDRKSSGSQFYIVHGGQVTEQELDIIEARTGIQYSPDQRQMYTEVGGTPHLDMQYTVFGRVIEGLEVIDKLAGVPTAPGDRPVEDVRMNVYVVK